MKQYISGNAFALWCRFGYASRGLVYLIIGGFAVLAAIDVGQESTKDTKSALQVIFQQPFGPTLLGIVALGLLAYTSWRLIQAWQDPDLHGTGLRGLAVRAGLLGSFFIHLGLSAYAFNLVFSITADAGDDGSHQDKVAWLMMQPFGQWLVGIVGVIIIIVGLAHFYKGFSAGFEKYLRIDEGILSWASPICRLGLVARGGVFLIIGGFVINAAIRVNPNEVRGLKQAMQYLESQPYGNYLFAAVAFGLVAFGLYNFIEAIYRRINTSLVE